MGDYRNSARRPNAQKSQKFDLVKPTGHPPFLARPGQTEKKSRQKVGVSGHPHFLAKSNLAKKWLDFIPRVITSTCFPYIRLLRVSWVRHRTMTSDFLPV